jgi:hypothetical protein
MWLYRRQTDCLITLTWAGGECWSCRQGGVAEAQNADPVRRFASLQAKPCKLDFDAALVAKVCSRKICVRYSRPGTTYVGSFLG